MAADSASPSLFTVCQWKVLPFGLPTAPRLFALLGKPVLFLCHCKDCMLLFTWMISWSLLAPSVLARELQISFSLF